jgi:FkbM family methyltransferase
MVRVSAARLLDPRAYVRVVAEPVRAWPATRAISGSWPIWIARQLLRPVVSLPCWIRTRAGARIHLSRDPIDDVILRHVMGNAARIYFPAAARAPRDAWILDVGAHHGIYAVEALRRSPGARLIAVEPDPAARAYFERNLAGNAMLDRVEYVEAALGDRSGRGQLLLAEESWGHTLAPTSGTGPRTAAVRLATATEVLAGRRPWLMKLNAEGAEFAVVPDLFDHGVFPDWIVLMIHPHAGDVVELTRRIAGSGYEISEMSGPTLLHCRRTSADARP